MVGVTLAFVPMVKVAVIELPLASWAFTSWSPRPAAGTVKVAVKLPKLPVVTDAGSVVTVAPSKVMVTLELAANPLPLTVTVSPTPPSVGSIAILDKVVKVAVASLPVASSAFMVWLPRELAGTVKVTSVKLPRVLVVTDAGSVVTVATSKVMVTLELAAKPVPLTVTVSPA
ncbi:hypothetical protein ES707_06191 [subsurface metagenome]